MSAAASENLRFHRKRPGFCPGLFHGSVSLSVARPPQAGRMALKAPLCQLPCLLGKSDSSHHLSVPAIMHARLQGFNRPVDHPLAALARDTEKDDSKIQKEWSSRSLQLSAFCASLRVLCVSRPPQAEPGGWMVFKTSLRRLACVRIFEIVQNSRSGTLVCDEPFFDSSTQIEPPIRSGSEALGC